MKNQLPSLMTNDAQAGLALANKLAVQLCTQMDQASEKIEKPGGMNYLQPAPMPESIAASILFYAIAAANQGWPLKR